MKNQVSMQKTKELITQLTWEFIGSIFIAAGIYNFAVQAISNDRIFGYFYYFISVAECSDWTFDYYTKYPVGYYLLSTSRKEILC